MPKLTTTIIEAAIAGFEGQKKSIDSQIAELRAMLTGAPETDTDGAATNGTKRKRSAAVRQRMQAAQLARWAKIRGESAPATAPAAKVAAKATRPKPHFSPAARKALSIAMKKRWAAKRAKAA